jgi:hypothetical protein
MPTSPSGGNKVAKMKTGFPCRQCLHFSPNDTPDPAYDGRCSAVPGREIVMVISGGQTGARMPKWPTDALAILENNACTERVEV